MVEEPLVCPPPCPPRPCPPRPPPPDCWLLYCRPPPPPPRPPCCCCWGYCCDMLMVLVEIRIISYLISSLGSSFSALDFKKEKNYKLTVEITLDLI